MRHDKTKDKDCYDVLDHSDHRRVDCFYFLFGVKQIVQFKNNIIKEMSHVVLLNKQSFNAQQLTSIA